MKKGFARRMLACLLAMCMMIGLIPTSVLAAAYDPTKAQVHVIVENTTFSEADGAPWEGVLVDTWVDLNEQSTMMNCVVAALEEGDYDQVGAENNYISEINGLGEFDGGSMSGWMGTLNDWFTNYGFGEFTVANGKLGAYDEIRIMYTCNGYGEDLGGSWGNNNTSLKAIEFSAGTLTPAFAAATTAYTLTVPAGTEAIKITPTAENKNFQVTASVGGTVYKRTQMVPVSAGTVVQIVVGGESMNEGATDTVYTFTVAVEGGEEPEEPQRVESFADVKVRAQAYGAYLLPVDTALHVSNLKAESYGFTDALEGVTALDVMVAAHEAAFGEDFTAETAADYMVVPASGFVGKLFGVETTSNGFLVNGGYPNDGTESDWGGYNGTMVTNTPVVTGDTVEFVIYADPTWLDQCTWVTAPTSVETGAEFEATVLGQYFMMGYNYATPEAFAASASAVEDACLAWVDMETGAVTLIEDAVTDEDGVATITAPEAAGTYYLTAATNEDEEVYVFMNPVAITVTEPAGPVTEATFTFATTNANTVIVPKLYKAADTEKKVDFLAGVEAVDKVYTAELEEGTYLLETFTADGQSNGTMKLDVTAENHDFSVFVVMAYCSTNGFTYGTDYEITGLKVMSGGEKATVLREVTIGDYETAGRKSFLVLNGDTYHFYGHPLGEKAETYTDTFKYGTVTAGNNCTASFAMSAKCQTTVTIPYVDTNNDGVNDYVLEFGQMTNYYIYTYNVPSEVTLDAEAATEVYSFETAKTGAYFYRVSNPLNADVVTYGNYLTASAAENAATVTLDQLTVGNDTLNRGTTAQNFEYNNYDVADLYLNINEKGFLNLSAGETFNLYPYRNWLAIEGISNAKVIEPDFHVEVVNVEGNPITVTEKTADDSAKHSYALEAHSAGTAIVLVTYDAMTHDAAMVNQGGSRFFSAIWPQNTGVFVVSVGADTGFETGMTINEGKNPATSKLSGDKIDSELDVLYYEGNEGASYTFTPAEGTTVSLAKGSINGGKLSIGAFGTDGVTVNADGSVTLSGLTAGKHVVKLVNGGKTEYQVIRAMQLSYKMYKGDAADEEQLIYSSESGMVSDAPVVHNEDKVTLVFNRVYHPANKLSGIYNMAGAIRLTAEDGTMFGSAANQYLMASNAPSQKVTVTVPKFFPGTELTLKGNATSSGFGSPYGSHRILTYEAGKTPNFTAGSVSAVFAQFPDIKIPVEAAQFLQASFVYTDDAGEAVDPSIVTVSMKDASGNVIPVAADGTFKGFAETYSYTMSADGYKYNVGSVTLTEDGTNVFSVVLDRATETSWDGTSISEPEKDEEGTFLISNGKEMAWFANEVTANKNVTANAKLVADIDLANYPWTPMGGSSNTTAFAGHFDGNGHEIEELFVNDQAYGALFACTRNALIENLTVSGNIRTSKANAGAIVGYAQGQNAANPTVIKNCVNKVNITTSCTSSNLSAGGFAGYAMYAQFINCLNEGTITATAQNTSSAQLGGIVGYLMNYASVIEGCKNTGAISGINSVGGIVGIVGGNKLVIKDCYNTGAISGNDKVGGIIGDAAGAAVTGCYSIGAVTGNSNTGAAIGANGGNASNVFYLNTVFNPSGFGICRDEAGLKGANISEAFVANCEGFPILTWEGEATAHTPEVVEVIDPTCLEEGYTNYKCSNCGLEYSETYVPALGHDATACVQKLGCRVGNCARCDADLFIWDNDKLANVSYPQYYLDAISFTDGAYNWIVNNGRLESNNVGKDSTSAETTFSVTAPLGGTISFGYGVSSESRYDKFSAVLTAADGTVTKIADAISGSETGTYEAELGEGTTTLKLTFAKDSSSASGTDRAWVENLVITANADPADIAAAAAVDEQILALGHPDELTLETFEAAKEAIQAVEAAFDALTDAQKELVTEADALMVIKARVEALQAEADKIAADNAAAEEMDEQIADLPAAEDIDFSNMKEAQKQVEEARAAYDALTDDQKALVDPEKLAALEAAEAALEELNDKLDEEITLPFKDVKKDAWYYDAVDYVYKTGIMSGMNETTFAPTKTVGRAQFAMMLYRLAGEPEVTYSPKFKDVKDGQWYTDAVMWASEAGVITGYNDGTFGPAKDITREQMATMLYRFETKVKNKTPEIGDPAETLKNYKDGGKVSAFAKEGFAWAIQEGIISGHEDGADKLLKPVNTAVRAEAATIMMRYMK